MSNNGICDRYCPPLMNDGRYVTDYRPTCYVHDLIMKQNNIKSSHDLKKFLQENARQLQLINRQFYDCKNKCSNCGDYVLPDPNGQISYWENYNRHIGYEASLDACSNRGGNAGVRK